MASSASSSSRSAGRSAETPYPLSAQGRRRGGRPLVDRGEYRLVPGTRHRVALARRLVEAAAEDALDREARGGADRATRERADHGQAAAHVWHDEHLLVVVARLEAGAAGDRDLGR